MPDPLHYAMNTASVDSRMVGSNFPRQSFDLGHELTTKGMQFATTNCGR
jgi:hypothetical protein